MAIFRRGRRSKLATITDTIKAAVLLALGVFLLIVALAGPAEREPHISHQRPATAEEIQQRQADLLMQELLEAHQEGQR